MILDQAVDDRIRKVADMLDRYVARHQELLTELGQQSRLAETLSGYEQMRAANNARAAQAKIVMYEPEIELLRHQLERMASEAGLVAIDPARQPKELEQQEQFPQPGAGSDETAAGS